MISDKKNIQQLASLLLQKGITDVVISPGSRNAPLINQFFGITEFSCTNIFDERCAAYFAIGIAIRKKKAVVVICTSGTAALNYAPAVAEAFYQKIPLIVVTADRPLRWIDQADGQTVRQTNIFENHVLKSININETERDIDLLNNNIQINQALNQATGIVKGPIHINIHLDEPLYGFTNEELPEFRNIEKIQSETSIKPTDIENLAQIWNGNSRKMIIVGQLSPDDEISALLQELSNDPSVIVLAEHISNINGSNIVNLTDIAVSGIDSKSNENYKPDILLSLGEQIVSKRLKLFIRRNKPKHHWHLSAGSEHTDTYDSLTKVIASNENAFVKAFVLKTNKTESNYRDLWKSLENKAELITKQVSIISDFSDLQACSIISDFYPENSILHLGNSSVVRLIQMFSIKNNCEYFGNRGTSGIDGSLSTALGFALHSDKINTVVLGDLSFFYDSNALLNSNVSQNIRIIIINNGGGNIFRLIGGPKQSPALEEHFISAHEFKAGGIAASMKIKYFSANNKPELSDALATIYADDFCEPVILEIFTDGKISADVFQDCYEKLKNIN